ncbi:MAG TPA: type VI secretion system membrane subunit TssM [Rhodoblastus sp.]|nr:type VI secretion system membrane subunit TssM [Rhodoblastus sp.]
MFKNSPVARELMSFSLYAVGLGSVYALVYTAGPYIAFGEYRPLESYFVREVVCILLTALVAGFAGFSFWRRRKRAQALTEGIAEGDAPDDSEALQMRMSDAMATLKASGGGNADALYDLPWYVIIGPPGAGKTTALVNSGLRFPIAEARGDKPQAVAGVGGTRYCDWWFTEEAVLIDTAGRYTTQDSDAKIDRKSWLAFLQLLKKNRPSQPINGVLIAISLRDLLTLAPDEIDAHARAIRARLAEVCAELKISFPVYALFTKSDLVAGFKEFFANLDENERRQVWGATFQTSDKTKNMAGHIAPEFDALVARLNERMLDRLQEEPNPANRVALFGFPAQLASLKRAVETFLNKVFEPTRYHAVATLRGFYFTSGTQEGTPIDSLIVALTRNFGAQEVRGSSLSGLGKSFFITDLIRKVIVGEAAWVSSDPKAVFRRMLLKSSVIGGALVLALAAGVAWWTSYSHNMALSQSLHEAGTEYAATAGDLRSEDIVGDRDFQKVEPLLQKLRHLPAGYSERDVATPTAETFGMSQRDRLRSSAVDAYRMGLERLYRPRLLYRLEEVLDARRDNPDYVYEALKVYMMLGGLHKPDPDFIVGWMRQDWEDQLYPGAGQASGRQALEDHLRAMLELNEGRPPLVELSGAALEDSQRLLARLSFAERGYQLLKSDVRSLKLPDWNAKTAAGFDAETVFEAKNGGDLASVKVPSFFTYAGFQQGLLDRLGSISDRLRNERWVLGANADQTAVAAQYDTLAVDIYRLYAKEFVDSWRQALAKLQMRRLTADKPRYAALSTLSGPSSPLLALFESIRNETALTREKPDAKKKDGAAPAPAVLLNDPQIGVPGSQMEAQFRRIHEWLEGGATSRPIDQLIGRLNEIKENLIISASTPAQAAQANSSLHGQLQLFRAQAARLPEPFDAMMANAAGSIETDVNNSELGQLTRAIGEKIIGPCQQLIPGRYPFERTARAEIALADFGRLFMPNGVFDGFFQQYLLKYADTARKPWVWRHDSALARSLSATTLAQFQRAAAIRDAFFATGGNLPSVNLQVFPPVLAGTGVTARFEVNGAVVTSQAGVSVQPGAVQWPGAAAGGRAAVTLIVDAPQPANLFATNAKPAAPTPAPAAPSGGETATLEKTGAWALFRLFDAAGASQRGDRLAAGFLVGGRELQYQFAVGSSVNPFTMSALREFRCPTGI